MTKNITMICILLICSAYVHGQQSDISELGNSVPTEHPLKAWVMYMLGKRVLVHHGTRSKKLYDSIDQKGLHARCKIYTDESFGFIEYYNNQIDSNHIKRPRVSVNSLHEFMIDCEKNLGLSDARQIFFGPLGGCFARRGNLGMIVDPQTTYVFNGTFKLRNQNIVQDFKKSKMLLSEYMVKMQKAQQMKQAKPDIPVYLDGQTGEPYYGEPNKPIDRPIYVAEIPYDTDHIPRNRLIMMQDDTFDVEQVLVGDVDLDKEVVC